MRLAEIYGKESFGQLEVLLHCLLSEDKRFNSGRPGTSAIYAFYKIVLPGPGADPAEVGRVARWAEAFPNSIYVYFARVRVAYAMAWNSRGGKFANEVSGESWQRFREGLEQADELLRRAPVDLKSTPIYYHLLLAIAQDSNQPSETRLAIFQEGITRWPQYYGLYENMLKRLVPKWGGSWELVDQAIRTWSSQRSAGEGKSLYSRLYARVLLDGALLQDTLIQWPVMRASLEDLVTRYPDHYNWSLAASAACIFRDRELFILAMKNIPVAHAQPTAWVKGTSPEACTQQLH